MKFKRVKTKPKAGDVVWLVVFGMQILALIPALVWWLRPVTPPLGGRVGVGQKDQRLEVIPPVL